MVIFQNVLFGPLNDQKPQSEATYYHSVKTVKNIHTKVLLSYNCCVMTCCFKLTSMCFPLSLIFITSYRRIHFVAQHSPLLTSTVFNYVSEYQLRHFHTSS